jgi:hypothetical protein
MNLNELAKKVSEIEGGKQNLAIAQIKEVISALGHVLSKVDPDEASFLFAAILEKGAAKVNK